ncbi:predicted protein [Sclerotinia sclerotiorum 1980 UF-70]|uniref:Uncharacterized protein n=1 Tax=Sclerotinia sclerotiorum (strain ATCC 18683 / 1980 / Ss-1) TaxID=665079 RepID=A7EKV4_SCLS1|nr:predicted protein [Sclerotinia sclerotiorum 1980 UF-70]EDO03470.1 predicted protein [Sclerotinia sclerotiorum 1980 UF-70]
MTSFRSGTRMGEEKINEEKEIGRFNLSVRNTWFLPIRYLVWKHINRGKGCLVRN